MKSDERLTVCYLYYCVSYISWNCLDQGFSIYVSWGPGQGCKQVSSHLFLPCLCFHWKKTYFSPLWLQTLHLIYIFQVNQCNAACFELPYSLQSRSCRSYHFGAMGFYIFQYVMEWSIFGMEFAILLQPGVWHCVHYLLAFLAPLALQFSSQGAIRLQCMLPPLFHGEKQQGGNTHCSFLTIFLSLMNP